MRRRARSKSSSTTATAAIAGKTTLFRPRIENAVFALRVGRGCWEELVDGGVGVRIIVTDHAGDEDLVVAAASLEGFSLECAATTPLELASGGEWDGRSRSDDAARGEGVRATAEVSVFDDVIDSRFDPHEIVSTAAISKVVALHGADMPVRQSNHCAAR